VRVAVSVVAVHLLAPLRQAPSHAAVLAAQTLAHGALAAALVRALQTAEAEEVAVLAAETAAAIHLGAVGNLAELHAAVLDAQRASLRGPRASLDGAGVPAPVFDAQAAELDGGGAPFDGAPLASTVGPAKAKAGVPLLAVGRLAQLAPAVRRAEALEVPGLLAALVRASLAAAVGHAERPAGGPFGAVGHLASLAAAVGDAEPAAGVHLSASLVGAALASAVLAAAVAGGGGFGVAVVLRANLNHDASVVLALAPGARGDVAAGMRAELLVVVVLHAHAPRLGALVAALVSAHPYPAVGFAEPRAEILGHAPGDDAELLFVDAAVNRALAAHLAHALAALLGASKPAAVGHAELAARRRAHAALGGLASLAAAVRDAPAAAAISRGASVHLAALAPAVGGALAAADVQLLAGFFLALANHRASTCGGGSGVGEDRGDRVGGEASLAVGALRGVHGGEGRGGYTRGGPVLRARGDRPEHREGRLDLRGIAQRSGEHLLDRDGVRASRDGHRDDGVDFGLDRGAYHVRLVILRKWEGCGSERVSGGRGGGEIGVAGGG